MHRHCRYTLYLFVLFVFSSGMGFSQSFEGIIRSEYYNAGDSSLIFLTWYIQPSRIALEMRFGEGKTPHTTRFVMDTSSNEMVVITRTTDGKKYFNKVQTSDIEKSDNFSMKWYKTFRTDDTTQMKGYKCRKLVSSDENKSSSCWIAEDMDIYLPPYSKFLQSDYDIRSLSQWEMKGFPMQSATVLSDGRLLHSVIVREIVPGKLSNSEFIIPKGTPEWKQKN